MKKIIIGLIICFTFLTGGVFAAEDGRYIYDSEQSFSNGELSSLNSLADEFYKKNNFNIYMLIDDSISDDDFIEYVENFYNNISAGNNGIILGINANLYYIYTSPDVEHIYESQKDELWNAFIEPDSWYDGAAAYIKKAEFILMADSSYQTAPANETTPENEAVPIDLHSRLVDMANLLTTSQEDSLLKKLNEISERQNCDVVVVTVNETGSKSPMEYADDYYDYNGYKNDGILLLLSMASRDWWISTTGFGITAVTDAGLDYMSKQFLDDLSNGNYADAFSTYAELCDDFITQAKAGNPYDYNHLPKAPLSPIWLLIALGIGLIVAAIATQIMKSDLKSVSPQLSAQNYVKQGSMQLTESKDRFLYSHISRTRKQTSSSSGGSSTHTSSSGTSHGGGGGKF